MQRLPSDFAPVLSLVNDCQQRFEARNTQRPFVLLTFAQTIDGAIADVTGQPGAISGEHAMTMTHALRANHDGILVGANTVRIDNPRLTTRLVDGRSPQRIIMSESLELPDDCNILTDDHSKPWMVISQRTKTAKISNFAALGSNVICVPTLDNRPDVGAILKKLHEHGIRRLMVEGGAQIIANFLEADLVDLLVLTVSPRFSNASDAVRYRLGERSRVRACQNFRLGEDLVLVGHPTALSPVERRAYYSSKGIDQISH